MGVLSADKMDNWSSMLFLGRLRKSLNILAKSKVANSHLKMAGLFMAEEQIIPISSLSV